MQISRFDKNNAQFIREASELLIESFLHRNSDCAIQEIENCLEEDRIASDCCA